MASLPSFLFRFLLKTATNWNKPLFDLRQKVERDGMRMKMPAHVEMSPIITGDVMGEWLEPLHATPDKVLFYLHGGGYVMGSCKSHRALIASIAQASEVRALSLDYRLAPEHPFPAALKDSLAAYQWLLQEGISPRHIIIGGDSAGGGLCLATLISLRDKSIPLPAAAVCISPWTDLEGTGESMRTRASVDPMITVEACAMFRKHYARDHDLCSPLISPLYGNLHSLPPLLIHVGNDEILLDDSTRLADIAREAGVDATLKIWNDMWHVFHVLNPFLPEARQAIDEIGAFVKSHFD